MKLLLILAGALCLTLVVSARPADEGAEGQEGTTDVAEGEGSDTTDTAVQEGGAEGAAEGDGETAGAGDSETAGEGDAETAGEGDAETAGEGDTGAGEGDPMADYIESGKGEGASQDGESEEGAEDAEGGTEGGEAGGEGGEGGEGGAKENPRNTYRQVHKLLKKIMKVNMKDRYLKSYVVGRLQERLMNPTIDLVSTIEKYSKIKSCFSSLEKDVNALVKESEKTYAECKKENANGDCGNEGTRELDEGLIDREQELTNCIVDKRDAE